MFLEIQNVLREKGGEIMNCVKTAQIDFSKVEPILIKKYWTWTELARQAHLSHSTILSLRSTRRKASILTIAKIAGALGVDPADITEREE